MASLVRVVDCPRCGASEFVLKLMPGIARSEDPPGLLMVRCADCGHLLADIYGVATLEPGTELSTQTLLAPLPT